MLIQAEDSKSEVITADEALGKLGGFGRYQLISLAVSILCLLCDSLYLFSIPFFTTPPEILCQNSSGVYEPCEYTPEYICTHGIDYKYNAPAEYNFATEFDLLCQTSANAWLTAVIFIGCLPGFIVFGFLGDVLGRITMILISIALNLFIMTMLLALPKTLDMVIVITGLIGFSTTALAFAPFSIIFEVIQEHHVAIIGMTLNVIYASSQIIVTFLALCEFSWRTSCMIIMAAFVLLLGITLILKDPPKYQLSKRRLDKTIESFKRIAKINKTKWDPEWTVEVPKNLEDEKGRVTELFTSSVHLGRHVLNTTIITACGMIYYGIIMNAPNVGTSLIANAILNAGAEILGYVLSGCLVAKLGFFVCIAGGITLAGISLLLSDLLMTASFPAFGGILMYIARFGNSVSYGTVMISSDMLFPPKIRNTAYLTAFGVAAIGEACVTYMIGSKYAEMIDACYFVMVVIGLLSTFALYRNPIT